MLEKIFAWLLWFLLKPFYPKDVEQRNENCEGCYYTCNSEKTCEPDNGYSINYERDVPYL